MDKFLTVASFIIKMAAEEHPFRILEISGGDARYGYLLKASQAYCGMHEGIVDRIMIPGTDPLHEDSVYNNIYREETLSDPHAIGEYDFILILDFFEKTDSQKARSLLDVLQYAVTKQIMIITPMNIAAGFRRYHPLVFLGLDFCYSLLSGTHETLQVYSVFPQKQYEPLSCDNIPNIATVEQIKIAFVLPHQNLTGGMKALLQQVRQLTKRGHIVNLYFRSDQAISAVPQWSDLTEEDFAQQHIIPASNRYMDHIQDADVILLGWMFQMPEFLSSAIPVALWEQGSEWMYGDFGKPLCSTSQERLTLHNLFRMPIHLLAVSHTNIAVLKGIYNRSAFLFPNGVDTEFYHPAEKTNESPVVLLVGNPSLAFKGFNFAFDVLQKAWMAGARFHVKWASQIPVQYGHVDFSIEVFVHPSQEELAELYRKSDIFLSTSLYESYPLPPLEAMASGTAVIATNCGGIQTYANDGENCILCRQSDQNAIIEALIQLLSDPDARKRLSLAGRLTAVEQAAKHTVVLLESYLFSIVHHEKYNNKQ